MSAPRSSKRRPLFGRLYPLMARAMDNAGMAERRRALLAGMRGQVVEVGAGDGATFADYPPSAGRMLAIEPQPRLRALAAGAAAGAPVPIEVRAGTAEHLPLADGAVDAVVFALVLCSVPDPAAALAEAVRVLKPGGQIRFLEHVRADTPGLARLQDLLDATRLAAPGRRLPPRPRHRRRHAARRTDPRTSTAIPVPGRACSPAPVRRPTCWPCAARSWPPAGTART
uniref:class I SAM-dependent methyltransferase n=1 Tax=Nonomuraea bangladeshensis TaxID=404385 RepID=UPI003F498C1B